MAAQQQPLSEIGELVSASLSGESLWWDGPTVVTHDDDYRPIDVDTGIYLFKMTIGSKVYQVQLTEVE